MSNQGKVKLARELAAMSKARFIEIEPLHRFTAAINRERQRRAEAHERMKEFAESITRLLEKEQRRLMKTWKGNP